MSVFNALRTWGMGTSSDGDWRDRAACRGHAEPDLWYPDSQWSAAAQTAGRICGGCPVAVECLAEGKDSRYGIWGGIFAPGIDRAEKRNLSQPKLTCAQGHPWVPENLYMSGGRRSCRECRLIRSREHNRAARQAVSS